VTAVSATDVALAAAAAAMTALVAVYKSR